MLLTRTRTSRTTLFSVTALVVVLGVSRCSSTSNISGRGLKAPTDTAISAAVAAVSKESLAAVENPAIKAVLIYRAAQKARAANQATEACDGYRTLALEPTLNVPEPVRYLARARTQIVCNVENQIEIQAPPPWLKEDLARASLQRAESSGSDLAIAKALYEVSFFEPTQNLRVERLQKSLARLPSAAAATSDPILEASVLRNSVIERLIKVAPRFSSEHPSLPAPDPLSIAMDLRQSRQFDAARSAFQRVAKDPNRSDFERLRAFDGIRMSYKLQLRTPEFIEASSKWQKFARSKFLKQGLKRRDLTRLKAYLDTRIQYARAVWTNQNPALARKILSETESEVAKFIPVHESMLIRSRIAEESGRFKEMDEILSKVAIDSLSDRATKARFLWYKGWNMRRLALAETDLVSRKEAVAKTISTLELASTFEDRHTDLTRNMFWTARLYKEVQDDERAARLLLELSDFSPFGFYGIVAKRDLKLPFTSLAPDLDNAHRENSYESAVASLPDSLRVPVEWFAVLGENDVARKYIENFSSFPVWDRSWSLEKKTATLVLLAKAEQHLTVSLRVDELSADERRELLEKRPELLFPLPFEVRILDETKKQGLPAELVYSIMRQESLFNPLARSPADAFGVMQLIPEMAAVAAKSLGVPFNGPEDLYDPDINIPLGTVFLKDLFKKYDDRFILAVAAYNANDRAIQGWLRTRLRSDPLEFIEEIPYDETRLYVKLVLRNYVTYQRRLSSTPVEFPESTLRLTTVF